MRGAIRLRPRPWALGLLVTIMMLLPAAVALPEVTLETSPLEAPTVPETAPDAELPEFLAWSEKAPIEALGAELMARVDAAGGSTLPTPEALPIYKTASDEERRILWRTWSLVATADAQDTPSTLDLNSGARYAARAPEAPAASQAQAGGNETPATGGHGMRGLWNLDAHGEPESIVPAEGEAYFLLTTRGVIRFSDAGAKPDWMVKPGYLSRAEVADTNGDQVPDLILGVSSFFVREGAPSIVVVDGFTGDVLSEAFTGADRLVTWRFAGVDGDPTKGIIGVTVTGDMIRAGIDGAVQWRVPLSDPTYDSYYAYAAWVLAYMDMAGYISYADVNGDGIRDMAITYDDWVMALVILVAYAQHSATSVVAYSGADGTVLWEEEIPHLGEYGFYFPEPSGDMNGDGNEDLLYWGFSWRSELYFYYSADGHIALAGADGSVLFDDRDTYHQVYLVPFGRNGPDYSAIGVADMDGDGNTELVTLEYLLDYEGAEPLLKGVDIVGRFAGGESGEPSVEIWRKAISTETQQGHWGIETRFRDLDADGSPQLVLLITGYSSDPQGNLTQAGSSAHIITPTDGQEMTTSDIIFSYDIHPGTGQAFVWTAADRWVAVDGEGVKIGKGMRLIPRIQTLESDHVGGDPTADILLAKSSGFLWIDGATGKPLRDIDRPVNRFLYDISRERGALRMLEWDPAHDVYWYSALGADQHQWRFRMADQYKDTGSYSGYGYVHRLADYTGDDRTDVRYYVYQYHPEEDVRREYVVYDPTTEQEIWSIDRDNVWSIWDDDVLITHPGEEMLISTYDDQWRERMELWVAGEDEPRWAYDMGATYSDYLVGADGFVVFATYGEGLVLDIVESGSGQTNATYALPADSYWNHANLQDVDRDGIVDVVVSYEVYNGYQDYDFGFLVYSIAKGEPIVDFELTPPREVEEAGEYIGMIWSYVSGSVGDWDRDGMVDFAFVEDSRPQVRSSADGRVLAAGATEGEAVYMRDLNGDGRQELGIYTAFGKFRFITYDVKAKEATDTSPVQTLQEPDAPTVEDSDFFSSEESGLIPAPSALLLTLALIGAIAVLRRRR